MPFAALTLIERPRLRPGAQLMRTPRGMRVDYRSRSCELRYPHEAAEVMDRFFAALREGASTPDELEFALPEIGDQIAGILTDLDNLRLLTGEAGAPRDGVVSGRQLFREVARIAERVKRRTATGGFLAALRDGSAPARLLLGYAVEYFHFVRLAPGILGAALSAAQSEGERRLLEAFLRSELGHDRFMRESLAAVGIDAAELERAQPLPGTFALIAALGVWAKQDLLSFEAVLFLFEEPQDEFLAAFEARAAALDLPKGFTAPLRRHAEINESAEHDAVSRSLLATHPAVSPEQQVVVKRNTALMVETLALQETEILDWYRDERRPFRRLFSDPRHAAMELAGL